jgi:hypothetical protein
MAAGKTVEACPKLEESQRLDPGSGTLVNLAKCYEDVGRIASAWSAYLEAAAAARTAGNAMREEGARAAAAALARRISKLVVTVAPDARVAGLVVKRDGLVVGEPQWGTALPSDAGKHLVEASAPGYETWRGAAVIEGESSTVTITVPKLVEGPAPPVQGKMGGSPGHGDTGGSGLGAQRVIALTAGGVGIVGLAVGTIFGLQAMSLKAEADKSCSGGACATDEAVAAGKDAHAAGNIATIGMVVGGVGLAGGLTLWFTAPEERQTVGVVLTVNRVTLRGTF